MFSICLYKSVTMMFNFAKLGIFRDEWIQLSKKVKGERKSSIYNDQTFMAILHTHGNQICRHNLTSNIINLCVIQWCYNKKNLNAIDRIRNHLLGLTLVNSNYGKTPLETHYCNSRWLNPFTFSVLSKLGA